MWCKKEGNMMYDILFSGGLILTNGLGVKWMARH